MSKSGRIKSRPGLHVAAFVRRLLGILLLLLMLVLVGTVGYQSIEGWDVGDAVYMTVTTLTAVGYEEVHPLSEDGRTFTMLLLLGGVTWLGAWFALITSFVVELDLGNVLRRRRIMREIAGMEGHVIVCGAGRTGRQVTAELERFGIPWLVIERDPKMLDDLFAQIPDAYVIEADATQDQTLIEAGVENASGLITCLTGDTDNLFVCLSARDMNPTLTIVARALEPTTMDKLYRSGATHVVSPNVSGALRMASVLLRPSVVSFLDVAMRGSEISLRMEQAGIDGDSPLAGKTLAEARIPMETGLIVIAVQKHGGTRDFVFNPTADTRLEEGDHVIVLGHPEQIGRLREYVAG